MHIQSGPNKSGGTHDLIGDSLCGLKNASLTDQYDYVECKFCLSKVGLERVEDKISGKIRHIGSNFFS